MNESRNEEMETAFTGLFPAEGTELDVTNNTTEEADDAGATVGGESATEYAAPPHRRCRRISRN